MKKIPLSVVLMFCIVGLSAQSRTTTKKKSTTPSQKTKVVPVRKSNTSPLGNGLSVRDRIEQRLRDSASSANAANPSTSVTVINGIAVPATTTNNTVSSNRSTATNATAPINSNPNITASSTTTGGNSVTNTNAPVQGRPIPGTIPVTPTNAADLGGKPITQEQTRNNATDVSSVQMNAINGNQVASAAQNPDNTTRNITNIVGESQWGTNQVGENQWTPPTNVISGFTRDFPAIRGATWTRDNTMNTFSARYRSGDLWASTIYNYNGAQIETRTELPLIGTLPEALVTFRGRQGALVEFGRISRVDRPGRETVYEVRLSTGRIAYVNNRGEEVQL